MNKPTAILTDIEGTTTSIAFVHDTLFPYARENMAAFVRAHADDSSVREQLDAVSEAVGRQLSEDEAVAQLIQWIDEDRKAGPLKSLQGMIWAQGYADGSLKGHVYADAVTGLRRWHAQGIALYVYSSGSVQAQRLIFGHTEYGDLTPLFSGYFDTVVGHKKEAQSYRVIADSIGMAMSEILFLSDIVAELDAAFEAGMQTLHLVRGESETASPRHRQVSDFDSIVFD